MSTVKSKKLQVGTDASASNNFTIYQPATPDGTLRIGVGNADSPTEVGKFDNQGYVATNPVLFHARSTANQSLSAATWTKVQFDTEDFDYSNNYDTTNDKFVAPYNGIYHITTTIRHNTGTERYTAIYVNGVISKYQQWITSSSQSISMNATEILQLNANDYVEIYYYSNQAGTITSQICDFAGHMIHKL